MLTLHYNRIAKVRLSINQYQYIFRGIAAYIIDFHSYFHILFFFLELVFGVSDSLVILGCALTHREPKSLRNLFPGAFCNVHFAGIFRDT